MLPQAFFNGDTVETARALVGKYLVRRYDGVTLAARITDELRIRKNQALLWS